MSDQVIRIIDKIRPVLVRHGVNKAELFGSAARDEMDGKSDVDVLVELPRSSTLFEVVRLRRDLMGLLKREVDVVTYGALSSRLAPFILNDAIKII